MGISAVLVLLLVQWNLAESTQPIVEGTTTEKIQKSNQTRPKRNLHTQDYFQDFATVDENGSMSSDYDYDDFIRELSLEQQQPMRTPHMDKSKQLQSLCKDFVTGRGNTRHDPMMGPYPKANNGQAQGRPGGNSPPKNVHIVIQNHVAMHKPQESSSVGSNAGQLGNNSALSPTQLGAGAAGPSAIHGGTGDPSFIQPFERNGGTGDPRFQRPFEGRRGTGDPSFSHPSERSGGAGDPRFQRPFDGRRGTVDLSFGRPSERNGGAVDPRFQRPFEGRRGTGDPSFSHPSERNGDTGDPRFQRPFEGRRGTGDPSFGHPSERNGGTRNQDEMVGGVHGEPDSDDEFSPYKGRNNQFGMGGDNFANSRPLIDRDNNFGNKRPFKGRDNDFRNNRAFNNGRNNGQSNGRNNGRNNFDNFGSNSLTGTGNFDPNSSWENDKFDQHQFRDPENPNDYPHNANCNPNSQGAKPHHHNIVIKNTLLVKPDPPGLKQTESTTEAPAMNGHQQNVHVQETSSEEVNNSPNEHFDNISTRQNGPESSEETEKGPTDPKKDARKQFLQKFKPENEEGPIVGGKRQFKSARLTDNRNPYPRKQTRTRPQLPRRWKDRPNAAGRPSRWDYSDYDDDFRSNSPTNTAEHVYEQTRGKHQEDIGHDSIDDNHWHEDNEPNLYSNTEPRGPPILLSKNTLNENFEDFRTRDDMIQRSTVEVAEHAVAPERTPVKENNNELDLVRPKANSTSKSRSSVPDPPRFLFSSDRIISRLTNGTLRTTDLKPSNTTSKGHILVITPLEFKQKKNQVSKKTFDQDGQASCAVGAYNRYLDGDEVGAYRMPSGPRKAPFYKSEHKTEIKTVVHPLPNGLHIDDEERRKIVDSLANELLHPKPRCNHINVPRELNDPRSMRNMRKSNLRYIANDPTRGRLRDIYLDDTSLISRPRKPTTIVINSIPNEVYMARHNLKALRPFQHNIDCDEHESWFSRENDGNGAYTRPRYGDLYGHRRRLSKFPQKHYDNDDDCLT